MARYKEKTVILFTFLIIIFTLTSCDYYVDKYSLAQTQSEKILKCFEEKDKETLKSMFSEKIRKRKELDSEIEQALKFFEGKIISYEPNMYGGDGSGADDGKISYIMVYPHIRNIQTDKKKKYSISGLYYIKNRIEPDNIGLVAFTIYDATNTKDYNPDEAPQVTVGDYGEY